MKLGTRAKYTLRLMMGIGRLSSEGKPVPLSDVSRHSGLSRRYLDQLVVALKNADLLRGRSGRHGGYSLSRPASEITVGEIIRAAIGTIAISECVARPETCMQSEFCQCRLLWQLINQQIINTLSRVSLADLLDHRWAKKIRCELDAVTNGIALVEPEMESCSA